MPASTAARSLEDGADVEIACSYCTSHACASASVPRLSSPLTFAGAPGSTARRSAVPSRRRTVPRRVNFYIVAARRRVFSRSSYMWRL